MAYRLTLFCVGLCLFTGCTKVRQDFGDFAGRLGDFATGKTPSAAARKMEDTAFADRRRQGINELTRRQFGRGEPYTTRYEQIAQLDEAPLVRATALRALNRSREARATPLFVAGLSATDPQIRLESAKGLSNLPDPAAVPKLLQIVRDEGEDRDLRIAAASALRHYKTLEVARTLVNQLNGRDFSIAWQSRVALREMTGSDQRYSETAWLELLTGPQSPLG